MLWGGRFKEKLAKPALRFSSSLPIDINLIREDIQVSKAHADMLAKVKIISDKEAEVLTNALCIIEQQYEERIWQPSFEEFEDIHSAIEARLYELVGETAGKLHTGRSRNDQVITDLRLWVKKASVDLFNSIEMLENILLIVAEEHIYTIFPGYTHLQRAQPVSFAFHLLAWYEMLERDKKRLSFVKEESDISPLGSCALAGSSLPLDREYTAQILGFARITTNSMDAVSDRDFVLDFLNACTAGMLHLSRIAEEIILWSTAEWNFISLSDQYSTGSSLMPQKKNPDLAELIRGKTGRVLGNYVSLASVLKALPLSYNRDLQEDKEPLFNSVQTYNDALLLTGQMIQSMTVNSDRFIEELEGDFCLATDLADWLVLKNIPFRETHRIVGCIIVYCEENKKKLNQLEIAELKKFCEAFDESVFEIMDPRNILKRKRTIGSTNPDYIKKRLMDIKIKRSS
jgi:argininosuccinate lyase